ncbi:MAG TPA: histidine kinase [Synergistales bacterium]|nr:histidine kinase [Synergistales bacterium]
MTLPKDRSEGLDYIWDKATEFLQYSMENIGYIRQEELDKFPETQNELSRVRQELEDLQSVTGQARREYEAYRSTLLNYSLSEKRQIQEEEYDRGAHLLRMISAFRDREKELREQEYLLDREVTRIEKLMSTSNEMANRVRLAMRVMNADLDEVETGVTSDAQALLNAYRIAERESTTLARDLHDGPAQKLASAVLLVELAERMIMKGENVKALDEFVEIKKQIRESLWDTRSFLLRLNPKGLEYGLDMALKRFIDQLRLITDCKISLNSRGDLSGLSMAARSNIYKIIDQAVMNAIRKGEAKNIQIRLSAGRRSLSVKIVDDGKGFDLKDAIQKAKERGSFGLMNMEERTRMAGGKIHIDTAPGKGTLITLEIPITEDSLS